MRDAVLIPIWLRIGNTTTQVGVVEAYPHPDDWQPKVALLLHDVAKAFDDPPNLPPQRPRRTLKVFGLEVSWVSRRRRMRPGTSTTLP